MDADGRTALSQHRRRSPAKKRASRRRGFLWPVMITAVSAIGAVSVAGYLVLRPGQMPTGAAIAAAAVPDSRAMAVLEQQRQQMIVMDAASHTMRMVGHPKIASRPVQAASGGGGNTAAPTAGGTGGGSGGGSGSGGGTTVAAAPPPNPGTAQSIAYNMMSSFGFDPKTQFSCLDSIWTRESGWNYQAENASGAYGIPQALPGSKMASAGADWQTNPATQIKWGLGYIKSTYGTPCDAWAFWQAHGYY
ncbi:MAG: lytic transglycosylase domain-containing protein [Actinobacteria bacterium]|nr:lytic transglycosylase domain-containing protein [Actinomycetota bacterium]